MAHAPLTSLMHYLRRAVRPTGDDGDGALVEHFLRRGDQSAFAMLVQRHGPMVLGLCQRLLSDTHDAEDAFQATFLVLARKAGRVRQHASLGSWLYRVAYRIALRARSCRPRNGPEGQPTMSLNQVPLPDDAPDTDPVSHAASGELRNIIDEEISRLPEKYRAPVIACYLEGLTNEEAAARLRWPVGSVKGRLNRARDLLGSRLTRRGVGLAATALGSLLAETGSAALPSHLLDTTVRAAAEFATGQAAITAGASAGAAELTQGALRTMTFHKFKLVAGTCAALAVLAGAGIVFFPKAGPPIIPIAQADDEPPAVFTIPAETPQVKSDREAVVKGNTEFAFDLYKKLAQDKDNQGKNLFLSPYSISNALAMTAVGANGKTLDEMASTLHFPVEPDRLHPAFAGLVGRFQATKEDRGYQLGVANSLWGQKGFHWEKDFLRTTSSNYAAGLRPVDFVGATEETRKLINGWVEGQTNDKIKDLLKPGILTIDTRMVLTNAIYFKGEWKDEFQKRLTHERPFHGTPKGDVQAPLMYQKKQFGYLEGDGFQALELPYKGDQLSMVVFLPKKVDGLANFEKQLTADNLAAWTSKLAGAEVAVSLPKFKVTSEFSLRDQLKALGMTTAFEEDADFSKMTLDTRLHIAAVIHKAFVDVNEEGTEAAAATAVVMEQLSGRRVIEFNADHPFVFMIRDKQSGSILFLGRLTDPAN